MNSEQSQQRTKLITLGPEKLADTLLSMAGQSDESAEMVQRLIATPEETVRRVKSKLSGLKRSRCYISWREIDGFIRSLTGLLEDMKEGVKDGKTGVELVTRFFECDRVVFDRCDDSNGDVGFVFRFEACPLFADFAAGCTDKNWLKNVVIRLWGDNQYGARDYLLEAADNYFSQDDLRDLAEQFWQLAEKEENVYGQRSWFRGVEELASLLADAPLFEKARLAAWGEPGSAARLDIAEMYLKAGDPRTALTWLVGDQDPNSFQQSERDQLLLAIHAELGNTDKVVEISWKRFREYQCVERLDDLLGVIGAENRDEVVAESVDNILANKRFSGSNAEFLLEIGCLDAAEKYLIQLNEQFDGDFYGILLPLAQTMEKAERQLAASLLYRALLDSILDRGRTKTYSHGIHYLKRLDVMASAIDDWRSFPRHVTYIEGLRQAHGRKKSFWGKYDQ